MPLDAAIDKICRASIYIWMGILIAWQTSFHWGVAACLAVYLLSSKG